MKSAFAYLGITSLLLATAPAPVAGQVVCSEFFSDPVSEGWELFSRYCEPDTWNAKGWYHQQLDDEACPSSPDGGADANSLSLESFNGTREFFVEFRVETDGDRSEIPFGAPTVVAFGNNAGVVYHITIASDLVQFYRDAGLPILYIEIETSVPHTYRIELRPSRYAFYIDGFLIDEGLPEGPFPANASSASWRGRSRNLPNHNAWDYIRYGVAPGPASGDYDSDDVLGLFDYYFVHDCLTKDGPGIFGGPEENAGPGCRFTDFDGDTDADLLDFAEFQNLFSGEPQ